MAAATNLRREALQLYREIVRTTKVFSGQLDGQGQDYATVLCASARKEFEEARALTSREEIYRRLVVGRDALHRIHDKVRGQKRSCLQRYFAATFHFTMRRHS